MALQITTEQIEGAEEFSALKYHCKDNTFELQAIEAISIGLADIEV